MEASPTTKAETARWRTGLGRSGPVAAVLAVLVLLAACGGNGSGDGGGAAGGGEGGATSTTRAAGPGGPCTLVSADDVRSAVGAPVRQAGSTDTAAGRGCLFTVEGVNDQSVLLVATTSPATADAFESARTGGPVETLGGLGDRAYAVGDRVVVLRGSTLLVVVVTLDRPPSARSQAAKTLAARAVTRL